MRGWEPRYENEQIIYKAPQGDQKRQNYHAQSRPESLQRKRKSTQSAQQTPQPLFGYEEQGQEPVFGYE